MKLRKNPHKWLVARMYSYVLRRYIWRAWQPHSKYPIAKTFNSANDAHNFINKLNKYNLRIAG